MDAARYARVADDVELLALVRRETGKVRVGQGRVDDARAAFAEAREGLLAAGLEHETVDVDAGLAECAALEGDLAAALSDDRGRHRAPRTGSGTRPRSATCTASAGACCCGRASTADAEQAFQHGLDSPDAGEGGCVRALNLLGRGLAARATGARTRRDLHAALATLRELGVEVLPHGLGHWVGVRTAHMVPRMSLSKRTSRSRSPALSRWLET